MVLQRDYFLFSFHKKNISKINTLNSLVSSLLLLIRSAHQEYQCIFATLIRVLFSRFMRLGFDNDRSADLVMLQTDHFDSFVGRNIITIDPKLWVKYKTIPIHTLEFEYILI